MVKVRAHSWTRLSLRIFGALGVAVALSGCVIEPLYGPHYYRPRPAYYYGGY